jgi:hypothetical protein
MTFRSRPAAKPTRRRSRRDDSRRAIYVTLSFTVAIASALALLAGVFAAGYYREHWAPVSAVNGESISFDDVRGRASMNLIRYQRQVSDFTMLRNQGKITSEEWSNLTAGATTSQDPATIHSEALTQLQKEMVLRQWADKNNVKVSDADVTEQMKMDATIPEMRHVQVIAVQPQATPPSLVVTSSDQVLAQGKAQKLLSEVRAGKKWADASTESGQSSIANSSSIGDMGMATRESLALDPELVDAVFALKKANDTTEVVLGSDGLYRFATVTSIVPEFVDADWEKTVGGDAYRSFARSEALSRAVRKVVEAKYISGPTVQRRVSEIAIAPGIGSAGDGDEVRFRVMVFAPGHNSANAANVKADDASWTEAKKRADDAVAALRADPSKWASMVTDTKINDDPTALKDQGGQVPWITIPWFDTKTSAGYDGLGMTSILRPIYADGLKPGAVLDPVQEPSKGWLVVILDGRRPGPAQRIADVQLALNSGADFATQAGLVSDAADANKGGDMGWVTKYMLTPDLEQAIWQTPVGGVSRMVQGNGYWIYKVTDEQTRVADADTQARLKKVVYQRWQADLQGLALVWTDQAGMTALAPATPAP